MRNKQAIFRTCASSSQYKRLRQSIGESFDDLNTEACSGFDVVNFRSAVTNSRVYSSLLH